MCEEKGNYKGQKTEEEKLFARKKQVLKGKKKRRKEASFRLLKLIYGCGNEENTLRGAKKTELCCQMIRNDTESRRDIKVLEVVLWKAVN